MLNNHFSKPQARKLRARSIIRAGMTLHKEVLARVKLEKGDTLFLSDTPDVLAESTSSP
ncbi:hypothetical protein [Uliginosibacterium sediminicola]|uniref:Uncharacterized protein n=1 Tax=Uliginosibacterium sediminicola TaxID=2024550 RepID=A0ABU9YY83_9RHOO